MTSSEIRIAYLTSAVDRLKQAIRFKDTRTVQVIFAGIQHRYPADARTILDDLIAIGERRKTEREQEQGRKTGT